MSDKTERFGTRPTVNKLGMTDDDYNIYRRKLVIEYVNDKRSTLRGITRREREKGIPLNLDRLRRWVRKTGASIRPADIARKSSKHGTTNKTFSIRKDQDEALQTFDNKSEIVQIGIDLVLGKKIDSTILVLEPEKNVIIFKENEFRAVATSQLTINEIQLVKNLLNKASKLGLTFIKEFAEENNIEVIGKITNKKTPRTSPGG